MILWPWHPLRALGFDAVRVRLEGIQRVRVRGVTFYVRALSPVDYLDEKGHPFWTVKDEAERKSDDARAKQVMQGSADPAVATKMLKQLRAAYWPVLAKGVVFPRVTDDGRDGSLPADALFVDAAVATALFTAIMDASLKKNSPSISLSRRLWNSISSRGGTAFSQAPSSGPHTTTTPLT